MMEPRSEMRGDLGRGRPGASSHISQVTFPQVSEQFTERAEGFGRIGPLAGPWGTWADEAGRGLARAQPNMRRQEP